MEVVPADRALIVLLLLLATALVAATALLVAARFGDGSLTQIVVAAGIIAFGEIVLVSLLLSPGDDLQRPALLAALGVLFAASLTAVRGLRVPALRPAARAVLRATRDPVVAIAAVAAVAVVAYSLALALFTPPNDQDALEYHLARAAFWTQQHSISYIVGSDDARLSSFPPNGEIAMAFTMISSGSSRFAPLVQLLAALAAAAAVYGIARRIGLSIRPALFGGLVFLTLPVVALQASTGLNDIVVAWLLASAVFFLLRSSPSDLVLAGIATALLVGTKLTGPLALPALGAIALVAARRRRVIPLAVLALATVIGSYWYAVNIAETGEAVGGFAGGVNSNVTSAAGTDVLLPIGRVVRLALASLELPGAVGLDRLLYVAAAAALALAVFLSRGVGSHRGRQAALVAAAATLAPLVIVPFGQLLVRANEKIFFELGRQDAGYLEPGRSTTKASPIFSWYGPASVMLVLASLPLAVRLVRRKRLPPVALLLGAGPLIWVVLVGLFVPYTEWNGRYVMGGVALASATWGVTLRIRPLALGAATVALVTAVLVMVHNHEKPAGVRLLEPSDARSVWTQPDWMVQAREAGHFGLLFRFFDERVRGDQRVAITQHSRGRYVIPFPFFGEDLSRQVVYAATPEAARKANADWAVLRTQAVGACSPGWRPVLRHADLVVLRRAPGVVCAAQRS